MSADTLVDYLNKQGYSPIGIPRERFDPLTILGGTSPTTLEPIGSLAELLTPGTALPEIQRDDGAPSFANRRGSAADAKAGFNLLSNVLRLFGGSGAKASAQYQRAASFEFYYLDVMHDFVPFLQILGAFVPERLNRTTLQSLASVTYLYIVTDTLKSDKLGVAAYDGSGAAVNVDADAIAKTVGASAGFTVAGGANDSVTYGGTRQLRFAFRAKRINYHQPQGTIGLVFGDETQLASRFTGTGPAAPAPPDAFDLPAPGRFVDIVDIADP